MLFMGKISDYFPSAQALAAKSRVFRQGNGQFLDRATGVFLDITI